MERHERLAIAFVAIFCIGVLHNRYLKKFEPSPEKLNLKLIDKHLLQTVKNGKPNLWIHTSTEKNARNWLSFNSRNTNKLNQPYIDMCVETIVKWCGDSFNVCLISDDTFHRLLSNWTIDLDKLPEPIKSRTRVLGLLRLLHKYGGVIMPNSFLMMRDMKPYHEKMLGVDNCYVGELVNRNSGAEYSTHFPSHKIIGAKKNNDRIKKIADYLEVQLSIDNTSETDFYGNLDRYIFKLVNNGAINLIGSDLVGTKDMEGDTVLLEHLLGEKKIEFNKNMFGVYIPKDELLKRNKYQWFTRMSKVQIISSNVILGKLFTLSYSN